MEIYRNVIRFHLTMPPTPQPSTVVKKTPHPPLPCRPELKEGVRSDPCTLANSAAASTQGRLAQLSANFR